MAKKIPVMSRFEADMEERYRYARALLLAQDEPTREVIDRMIRSMENMAGKGFVKIRAGKNEQSLPISDEVQGKMFLWSAMKILVALARMDLQVANFTPTPDACIECGKPVKRAARKRGAGALSRM